MLLPPLLLASCLVLQSLSDHITVADLVPAFPTLKAVAPETPLALAPAPGVVRVFRNSELRSMADRWSVEAPEGEICIGRPVTPLDPNQLLDAMQRALPEGTVEILEYSHRAAPKGEIDFSPAALHDSPAGSIWTGYINYDGVHRFSIWARVKVRLAVPVVIALRDLLPGQPVSSDAIQARIRDQGPGSDSRRARSPDEIVGRWPRARIPSGSVILTTQLEEPKAVTRGDLVQVAVQSGSTRLETEARAEAAGAIGDMIPVRNLTSQKRFLARVSGKDRVSVESFIDKENP